MNEKRTILYSKDLKIQFGGLYALDGVDIDILENEIVGLIGPNGSGKTTFFNVVTGVYIPTSGEVMFDGTSIVGKSPYEIHRMGLSRTYQTSRLCMHLSVLDNILIGLQIRHTQTYFDAVFKRKKVLDEIGDFGEQVIDLLEVFNPQILPRLFEPVDSLSQIDRRRVEICRAMAAEPKIILLDEPSAGMTPDETVELMDDIKKVRSTMSNVSIMIVEHDMSVISSVSERVIAINFGREIARGTYAEVADTEEVKEAYLGKEVQHG